LANRDIFMLERAAIGLRDIYVCCQEPLLASGETFMTQKVACGEIFMLERATICRWTLMLQRPIAVGEETFMRGPHLRMDVYSMLQMAVVGW
jgi:hypothetical protein